jgi:hypothetical protein
MAGRKEEKKAENKPPFYPPSIVYFPKTDKRI